MFFRGVNFMRKNAKRFIFVLSCCILCALFVTLCLTNTVFKKVTATEYYNSIISSSEWEKANNSNERREMLQLPEEMIESMSTDELVEAVLEYPFFTDVFAFDNYQDAVDDMYDGFNGLEALSQRSDAPTTLLKKYSEEPVLKVSDEDGDVFRLYFLEILLSQDFVLDNLTDEQEEQLSELATEKYSEMKKSDVYSDLSKDLSLKLSSY